MFLLESKIWKDLSKTQGFLTCIKQYPLLYFCRRKNNKPFLLTSPSDMSRIKTKNITYNILSIIRVTTLIGISETNQQSSPHWTVMYPKLNCILDITKYPFCGFFIALVGFSHILDKKTNNKGNIKKSMSQIQNSTN
jgi:hypothetical protein